MHTMQQLYAVAALSLFAASANAAPVTYWNLFNIEGESAATAQYVTYATLADMLVDANRIDVFTPNPTGFGPNIVGSDSDGSSYWNLFNIEGESAATAQYVTYATLADMLVDANRIDVFTPNPTGFGPNIVGSGSDGSNYWNLFNIEGESAATAQYVTYATLADMLVDANRIDVFTPNPTGFGPNIVGSGSDGSNYWNLFNIEGESAATAQYVTYATLADMLVDANRIDVFTPNPTGFGPNIVGSGASVFRDDPSPVPEPATGWMLLTAFAALPFARRWRGRYSRGTTAG